MRHELICTQPADPPLVSMRTTPLPHLGPHEVRVRVQATSVNPIDTKRAGGYGHKLLGLKGAARFPLVLGNDLAGVVEAVGPHVSRFTPGQAVFGVLATGRKGGAHTTHAVVHQDLLLPAPAHSEPTALAVLPYSFTTMWLALRGLGLNAGNAQGKQVLIHGSNGGLGRLALQVLVPWGCEVTAICAPGQRQVALDLGARHAVDAGPTVIRSLPSDFDAVLNFASWEDDAHLAAHLGRQALGQATTVHPLLGHFDRHGWLGGAWASRRDWRRVHSVVRSRAPLARYNWTIFKPDPEALSALAGSIRHQGLSLPVGLVVPLTEASRAFRHVARGQAGRAVLLP